MKKTSIQKLLLSHAFILFCGFTAHAQGWVGDGANKLNTVNNALGLTPITVGIGTNAPSEQFHTTAGVRFQGLTQNDTAARIVTQDVNGKLFWRNAATIGGAGSWLLTGNTGTNPASNFLGTTDNQRLVFRTNNTERATILANGNIGIGLTSPLKPLHVDNKGAEDNNIWVSGASPSIYLSQTTTVPPAPYTSPIGRLALATRIGAHVQTSAPGDLVLLSITQNASLLFGVGINAGDNGIERMRINDTGYVGINTIDPTAYLHVKGTVRFENLPSGTGNVLVIDASGNVRRGAGSARTSEAAADNAEVTALKKEVDALKQTLADIQQQLSAIKKGSIDVTTSGDKSYSLSSAPNPFNTTTRINYTYPSSVNKAFLNITDLNGRPVKQFNLTSNNANAITLTSDVFSNSGTYIYSLELDGKVVESKKLVVAQ